MKWIVGGMDLTQRVTTASWSGSIGRCARELDLSVAVYPPDPNLPPLDLPLFSAMEGYDDSGRIFLGMVVRRKRDSDGALLELTGLDRGYQLSNNQGWYSFKDVTPEAASAVLAADFGISLGSLAKTSVRLSRKFPGVPLHRIVDTLYTLAGQKTGEKYQIRFEDAALCVRVKPSGSGLVLAPKVNIMTSSIDEDATDAVNSVAIYSETGTLIRTLGRAEDQALAGLLQAAVIQRDGEDATDEAQEALDNGEVQQSVTVDCRGDTRLITGEAVLVRETSSGVKGLFWIDSDTHTWKNGLYVCRLTLNFKNLMNDTEAGGDL